jgi:hypothetical protein
MNEEAIRVAYELFVADGYTKSIDEFKTLMKSNKEGRKVAYDLFVQDGYGKKITDFEVLMGANAASPVVKATSPVASVEKKNPIKPTPQKEGTVSPSPQKVDQGGFSEYAKSGNQIPTVASDNTRIQPPKVAIDYQKQAETKLAVDQYKAKRSADMAVLTKEEQKKKAKAKIEEDNKRTALWKDPNFDAKVRSIDANLIGKNDKDVLPILRDQFAEYGFVFEESGLFGIGDNIVVKNRDGSKEITIDLDAWTDAGENKELNKLRDFVKINASTPTRTNVIDDEITKAIRAKQLRKKGRQNEDGSISTVKFESANIDGKEVVYPTLFPKIDVDGNYGSSSNWWTELSGMEAYKEALKRGEVFIFKNEKEAQKFAEGSWKDFSNVDVEGQMFFKKSGRDYIQEKKRYEEYINVRDQIDFIEDMGYGSWNPLAEEKKIGSKEGIRKYPSLFVNGKLRDDANSVLSELKAKENKLYDIVMDDESQKLRESWDFELSNRQVDIVGKAITQNNKAKKALDEVSEQSIANFGVSPEKLAVYKSNNPSEQALADKIYKSFLETQSIKKDAAAKYEIAKTYYNAQVNKNIRKDFSDNFKAVSDEISTGYNRGLASEVILLSSLGIKYDMNDPNLRKLAAEKLVEYTNAEGETQSRVLSRFAQATGGKEVWDVIKSDPLELFGSWAFSSLAQLLPYGTKLVAATTAAGASTGAVAGIAGGPLAGVTTPVGAAVGATYGFRTGMGLAALAMEYSNEMLDAITTMGYQINDPESVEKALLDPEVWALGKERGLKRGIPIALVDFVTAGTVGKVLKTGSLASKGRRIGVGVTERMIVDPASEAAGEALAQITVGDELDYKEIIAEAGGGIGNNSSYVAINAVKNARAKNNVELAGKLGDINFLSREISSDKRISDWANNMHQLGKIDADQNQRIQENVGLRSEARNLLDVGGKSRKYSGAVESRVMTLLAAREELSSTANRKSVFSNKISEINTELEEIATTKNIRPQNEQTLLAGTGVISSQEQATGTDIREAVGNYQIGKKKVTKEEFLSALNKMSVDELKRFNGRVDNDEETLKLVIEKLAPYQEASTTETTLNESEEQVGTTFTQDGEFVTFEYDSKEDVPYVLRDRISTEGKINGKTKIRVTLPKVEADEILTSSGEAVVSLIPEEQVVSTTEVTEDTRIQEIQTEIAALKETQQASGVKEVQVERTAQALDAVDILDREKVLFSLFGSAVNDSKAVAEAYHADKTASKETSLTKAVESLIPEEQVVSTTEVTEDTRIQELQTELDGYSLEPLQLDMSDNEYKDLLDKREQRISEIQTEIAALETLPAQETNVAELPEVQDITPEDNEALLSEVADLETVLSQPEGRVDFRLKTEDEVAPAADEVEAVVRAINAIPSGNVSTTVSSRTKGVKIDAEELGRRTKTKPKTVSMSVINGIPAIFTISDQLTTGDVVNPNTGNTISNLKGGIGYTFIEDQDAAWANTTKSEAGVIISKAQKVYENNKPLFEKWWSENLEYNGLVPMNVVKMGPSSILSNEATFRVLQDNLTKFPEENRIEALSALKKNLQDIIDKKLNPSKNTKPNTVKNYAKEAKGFQDVLKVLNNPSLKSIEDVLSKETLDNFSLPTKTLLLKTIAYGTPNDPGQTKSAGEPKSIVSVALMKNQDKQMKELLNLGFITDLITDPSIKNVPQRSIISIQGVDVLNPKIIETTHPNYKYGVAGKSIGILNESAAIQDVYPEAYNAALKGLVKDESQGKTYTEKQVEESKTKKNVEKLDKGQLKPSSLDTILVETVGVQNGLPGLEFVGAVANGDIRNINKLINFLNTTFPGVIISTDSDTFNNVINSEGVMQYLKGDEIIYGVTTNGDIYINPDVHRSESALFNTAIHEMGHVWTDYLKTTEKGKQIYAKGLELAKQTDEYQKQLKKFNGDSIKAANETVAVLIGNKGQTIADASIKSKFEEWLLGMWKFIKQQFKMSKDLSEQEIQDLTLDEFIGTALADIFNGKEIKITDEQLKQLKNPEAAFSSGQSMSSIVQYGRQNGFSDASIKQVLLGRGFKVVDIDTAMSPEYMIDLFTSMPPEFGNLEGGILEGKKLFNEVRDALNKWAVSGPRGGVGKTRTKTYADIRQKGMDLMKANPIFQNQPDQVQKEVLSAFDRSLGINSNRNVQKQMSAIRNDLKQRKIGANNLKAAQIRLKNFVRANLPKSNTYTQGEINKLVSLISNSTPARFERDTEKVLKIVEQQREKMKKAVIKEIYNLVDKKSKSAKTKSGKRRSSGLDAIGQSFFAAAKPVLKAIIKGDSQVIADLQQSLNEVNPVTGLLVVDEAIQKELLGEDLTTKEQILLNKAYAFDTFSDLDVIELEDVENILSDLKETRSESIARLKSNRALRAAENDALKIEATSGVQKNFKFLFNEDGSLKNVTQLRAEREKIWKDFTDLKFWSAITSYAEQFDFMTGTGMVSFFRSNIQHLGTYCMTLDANTDGFFTKNIYGALNIMDENHLKGYFRQVAELDIMANSIPGNTKGYKGFRNNMSNKRMTIDNVTDSKSNNSWSQDFSIDQLMRIYSLSKNDVQREKLRNMGFGDSTIQDIKDFIGSDAVQMADMMVDYFSNTYFDSVNDVYKQVNNTSLGYVPNYFPTRTINPNTQAKLLSEGNFNGIFDSENAPALKDRKDISNDIDLNDGFIGVVENHFQSMERFKSYANGVKDLNYIINIPAVKSLLKETGMTDLMNLSINAAVNPNAGLSATRAQTIADKLSRKLTGFALAFKSIQILKQATSFIQAFEKYNYRPKEKRIRGVDSAIDLVMFMVDYAKIVANLPVEIQNAMEISASFKNRMEKGLGGDLVGLSSGRSVVPSLSQSNTRFGKFNRGFKQAGAAPTVLGDAIGVLGYMANYKRDIANGMSKAEALERFNNFNSTQQTRRATEKNQLQIQQAWYARVFTMFGSTVYLQINKVAQSTARIMKPIMEGKPGKVKTEDIRALALNFGGANVAFAFAANIMKFVKGDDDDKEQALNAMKDAMLGLNLIYQIPLFGTAVEVMIKRSRGDFSPTSDIVSPLSSPISKINKAIKTENPLRVIQPVFEMGIGTQVDPFIGFGEMISGQGDDNSFYDALGISSSYRPGYNQKKSKGNSSNEAEMSKEDMKELFPNNPDLWK